MSRRSPGGVSFSKIKYCANVNDLRNFVLDVSSLIFAKLLRSHPKLGGKNFCNFFREIQFCGAVVG